jgi:hypothetical protein
MRPILLVGAVRDDLSASSGATDQRFEPPRGLVFDPTRTDAHWEDGG